MYYQSKYTWAIEINVTFIGCILRTACSELYETIQIALKSAELLRIAIITIRFNFTNEGNPLSRNFEVWVA